MSQDRADIERIERLLDGATGPVSQADIAAGTGIDVATVDSILYDVMLRFECTLDVRDDGTIIYDFGGSLRRLDRPSLGERLRKVGRALWRGFTFIYKSSLAILLVGYAVAFVVFIIAMAIAASAAAKDEAPAEGAFRLVGAVFRAIFEFVTWSAIMYPDVDMYGYRHRRYEPKRPVLRRSSEPHAKSFMASVYDFVFGPARVEPDDGTQDREVASFVRESGGVLTVSDVQALSGLDRVAASRFFARFVARFDGDATVTEGGALVARFPGLLQSVSTEHDEPIEYYWDEYEPPFHLNGNSVGRNMAISLLAGFNLAGAAVVLQNAAMLGTFGTAFGVVPLVLFSLFFAIPLLRAPLVWWRNRQQHEHNIRKRLFRAAFAADVDRPAFEDVFAAANQSATTEETLDVTRHRSVLEHTTEELGGHVDFDDDDRVAAALERLRTEQRARREAAFEIEEAEGVFSTAEALA